MKKIILLTSVFLLAGCNANSQIVYTHSINMNSFEKDKFECELIARNNTMPVLPGQDFITMVKYHNEKNSLYEQCLSARGYYKIQVK